MVDGELRPSHMVAPHGFQAAVIHDSIDRALDDDHGYFSGCQQAQGGRVRQGLAAGRHQQSIDTAFQQPLNLALLFGGE